MGQQDIDYQNIVDGDEVTPQQARSGPGFIAQYCDAYNASLELEICCDLSEICLDDITISSWTITAPAGYDGQKLTLRLFTPGTYVAAPRVNFTGVYLLNSAHTDYLVTTKGGYDILNLEYIEATATWLLTSIASGFVPAIADVNYRASAVALSGAAFTIHSLTLAATPYYGFSVWLRTTNNDSETMFIVDPASYYAYNQFSSGTFDFRMATSTGAHGLLLSTASLPIFDGNWHHVLFAMDNVAMSGICYVDDVLTTITASPQDAPTSAGNIGVNGTPFVFGTDTFGADMIAEFADFAFWGGTNLIVGGVIPLINRRKFISASKKPVDPENLPITPAVLLSGNASTIQYNHGNGGTVVLTGTAPIDAETSPSD